MEEGKAEEVQIRWDLLGQLRLLNFILKATESQRRILKIESSKARLVFLKDHLKRREFLFVHNNPKELQTLKMIKFTQVDGYKINTNNDQMLKKKRIFEKKRKKNQLSRNKFNQVCLKGIYEKKLQNIESINGKINHVNSQVNLYIQCDSN